MAEAFTEQELEELRDRAHELARDEDDPGLRSALQLLGETANNLIPKVQAASDSALRTAGRDQPARRRTSIRSSRNHVSPSSLDS
jgi:hypothetical protein